MLSLKAKIQKLKKTLGRHRRFPRFRLRRPSRATWFLLGSISVSFVFLYAMCFFVATRYASYKMQEVVADLEHRSGVRIVYEEPSFSFASAAVETVTIGDNSLAMARAIAADINLNPFSNVGLGNISQVTVEKLIFRSGIEELKRLIKSTSFVVKPEVEAEEQGGPVSGTIAKAGYLLKEADIVILGDNDEELVALSGLTINHTHDELGLITFELQSLRIASEEVETHISGSLVLDAEGKYYPFQVSQKSEMTKWDIKGRIHKNLTHLQLTLKSRGLSPGVARFFPEELSNKDSLVYASKVSLSKPARSNEIQFFLHAGSPNMRLDHPRIVASGGVGPVRTRLRVKGKYDLTTGHLTVSDGQFFLGEDSVRDQGKKGTKIEFMVAGAIEKTGAQGGGLWNVELRLPLQRCQDILGSLPKDLIPTLAGFSVSGQAAFAAKLSLDQKKPEGFNLEVTGKEFSCGPHEVPYKFSKDRLSKPFSVELKNGTLSHLGFDGGSGSESFVPLEQIPKTAVKAFLAAEDIDFYHHHGFNFFSIQEAMRRNLAERKIVIGGSTISMQTSKNLFLSGERTLSRKLQEWILTWYLESILPKDRIMEIYLNIIEYGPDLFGIGRASRHFFDKAPQDLNLKEAVYIASVLPSPIRRYSNFCRGELTPNYQSLLQNRLQRMLDLKIIGEAEFAEVSSAQLTFSRANADSMTECKHRIAKLLE